VPGVRGELGPAHRRQGGIHIEDGIDLVLAEDQHVTLNRRGAP
jgi:hypothetical protein